MKTTAAGLLAALLSYAPSALAAPPAAPPPAAPAPAPASTALTGPAAELARVLVPKESWSLALQQMGANVQRTLEGHPGSKLKYPADMPAKIRAELEGVLPYDALVAIHAKEISAQYTPAEMNELLAFYRTPVGKKWLAVQPKVSDAVAAETQRRVEQKMPDVMQRLAKLSQTPPPAPKAAPGAAAKAPAKK